MDSAQIFIFGLGWVFFAAWGLVLAAVSAIAFGKDLFPSSLRHTPEHMRLPSRARGI